MAVERSELVPALHNIATQLRIDSVRSTSRAGSGHPSTCCSAAEIMAAAFFAEMRFDPRDPQRINNDRFVMSKGHAAPILYAAWAEAGAFDRTALLTLREIGSDLEGHPTPRLPFVDVATGSLGQGLPVGVGLALNARRIGSDYRTYVLLGDGESAEGSVWEAADVAAHYGLDNLCAITDVNALGQSQATQWQHDMEQFARRWRGFGWEAIVVDGHDLDALLDGLARARATSGRPTMLLAKTVKGKGISFIEGKNGWHGRPLKRGAEEDAAIKELEGQFVQLPRPLDATSLIARPPAWHEKEAGAQPAPAGPAYSVGDMVATREAYGNALVKLGQLDDRIVAIDADVGIESRIADIVGSKKALFTGLFDGASDEVSFERAGTFLSRLERVVEPAVLPQQAVSDDVVASDDDGAEREIEAVVAAGDESRDMAPSIVAQSEPRPSAAEIQRLVSGLSVQRTASGGLVIEARPEAASTLAALFSGMAQLLQAAASAQDRT